MMRFSWRFGALALFGVLASLGSAQAAGYSVLYRFQGGSDGSYPNTTLIKDKAGNLYGTTYFGGGGCDCGTMFRLAPDGTETVLHGFDGDPSSTPSGQLNLDGHGNLYGVAIFGGQTSDNCDSRGCGSVFRLAPDGTFDVLHKFTGSPDGANEGGTTGTDGLLKATHGNHYGTTELGGTGCSGIQPPGCGTIYKIGKGGTETVLYSFQGGSDGAIPFGRPTADSAGNLYGTTYEGGSGCDSPGCGTIWRLAPDSTETILHTFTSNDGIFPESALVRDAAGNLYGTASLGGSARSGTVFKLAPDGTFTVLYNFLGSPDGAQPLGILRSAKGYFYGVTLAGGEGGGTVFELNPNGVEVVLHTFFGGYDGWVPAGGLLMGMGGDFYGTTFAGGGNGCNAGCGTVFKVHQFH